MQHLIGHTETMLCELVDASVFHPLRAVLADYEAWQDGSPTIYPGCSRIETLQAIAEALELSR